MIRFPKMGRVPGVALLLCGFASQAQPFTNGGFEIVSGPPLIANTSTVLNPGDTWLTGWNAGGPDGTVTVQNGYAGEYFFGSLDGMEPFAGQQWIIFPDDVLGGSLSQTVSTLVGAYCTMSFESGYVYSPTYSSQPQLGVAIEASNGAILTNSVYNPTFRNWSSNQVSFVANTSTTTLTFSDASVIAQSVDIGLDEVTLVTEPPGWPYIITSPLSETNAAGTQAIFSATAGGNPSTVQWYLGTNAVPGATNTTLTVTASIATAGNYTAVFSNALGTNATQPAALTVLQILASPLDQTVNAGAPVIFSATANLSGATNQWYLNGYPITGATSPTLEFTAGNQTAGTYTVKFGAGALTNTVTTTSAPALLTVLNIPFVNGSFEYTSTPIAPGAAMEGQLGDTWLNGWNFGGTGSEVFVFNGSFLGLTAADGNQWVIFDSQTAPPPGVIWQTFSTLVGTNYFVNFETMAVYYDGTPFKSLTATARADDGLILASDTVTPGVEWETNQLTFTATTVNTTLAFTDNSAPNYGPSVALDAVSVSTSTNQATAGANVIPTLTSLSFIPASGSFVVRLAGQAGQTYVMQTSTNLKIWFPVSTNVLAGSSVNITNSVIFGATRQFWSAVPAN